MTDDDLADAYRRYGAQVLLRCRRILRDEAEAEDALHDVFMKLWRYGAAFGGAQSKLLWLYRVADRCSFDRLARRRSLPQATIDGAAGLPSVGSDSARVDDGDLIVKLLSRMEDSMQRIAVLYYFDEMTQEEIATETGWSRQTINKKLGELRDRLITLRSALSGDAR